ncbi:MAG: flippase-like domain-containing protein, partial [Hahellaceae bacterium]|nr:flippase-like domain-containing protein [Hahellaceae bacterium]
MKSKSLFKVLRVIITVLLLAYVFWKSGLFSTDGRAEFIGTVGSASLFYVLLSIMFPSFLDFISSIKWHYLSRTIGIPSRPLQLWAYYIMGRFFNLVLPSNIGGDITRVHLHGKASGMKAQCAAAVFMERFTGLIALILIALVIGWLQSKVLNIPFMDVAMLVTMGATLFGGWAIIDDRLFNWLRMLSGKL